MSRAAKLVGMVLVLLLPACATTRTAKVTPAAEAEATMNALRAQNSGYMRRVEELQNRIFILEDRLDSVRVVGQQRAVPTLPVSRTLGAARAEEVTIVEPDRMPPRVDPTSNAAQLDSEVEYGGEAVHPVKTRPVLQLDRPVASARARVSSRAPRAAKRAPASAPPVTPPSMSAPLILTPSPVPSPSPSPAPAVVSEPAPVAAAPAPRASAMTVALRVPPDLSTSEDLRPPEPIPAEPLRDYRAALLQLRAGHHAEALAGFRRFLGRYPTHDYADNAQYWIGECYYDLKQHQTAAREFRRVIERYPSGNKVPDALLKLGFSHLMLGQTVEGRQVLESLVRAYPRHASAALATTRLGELRPGKADVSLGTIVPGVARPPAVRPPEAP